MCNCNNNPFQILTTSVAISGSNLVLTIPDGTYLNCRNYLLRLAQDIPSAATTLYSFRQKSGHNVYATQLKTRRNYVVHVAADSGEFVAIRGWFNNCNCGTVTSLPVATGG